MAPEFISIGIRVSPPARIALVKEQVGAGLAPPTLFGKAPVLPPPANLRVGVGNQTAQQPHSKGHHGRRAPATTTHHYTIERWERENESVEKEKERGYETQM